MVTLKCLGLPSALMQGSIVPIRFKRVRRLLLYAPGGRITVWGVQPQAPWTLGELDDPETAVEYLPPGLTHIEHVRENLLFAYNQISGEAHIVKLPAEDLTSPPQLIRGPEIGPGWTHFVVLPYDGANSPLPVRSPLTILAYNAQGQPGENAALLYYTPGDVPWSRTDLRFVPQSFKQVSWLADEDRFRPLNGGGLLGFADGHAYLRDVFSAKEKPLYESHSLWPAEMYTSVRAVKKTGADQQTAIVAYDQRTGRMRLSTPQWPAVGFAFECNDMFEGLWPSNLNFSYSTDAECVPIVCYPSTVTPGCGAVGMFDLVSRR